MTLRNAATKLVAVALVLSAPGCGSGGLSIDEYAGEIEDLVNTMNATIDALYSAGPRTVESTRALLDGRVAARETFTAGLAALDPPDDAAELHAVALDLMARLSAAEQALADRAHGIETFAELNELEYSSEAEALREVDRESIALCRAAEDQLDTSENAMFEDTTWMTGELRNVVRVAFRCTAEERADTE